MDLGELDDRVVVEVAGRRDDDVRARVAVTVVAGDLGNGDRPDHVGLAQDAAAQGMVAVYGPRQDVVDPVLRLVLVHGDLLEDDRALGVDLAGR